MQFYNVQVKAYMDMIEDIHHPLDRNIDATRRTGIKRGSSWLALVENNIQEIVTNIDGILGGAECIQSDNNYNHVVITPGT